MTSILLKIFQSNLTLANVSGRLVARRFKWFQQRIQLVRCLGLLSRALWLVLVSAIV